MASGKPGAVHGLKHTRLLAARADIPEAVLTRPRPKADLSVLS